MSRVCEITGKKVMVGNNVSHSQRKTKRRFYPNLQRKRFYIPEEDRWVTLRVSAKAIRTISKIGVLAAMKRGEELGVLQAKQSPRTSGGKPSLHNDLPLRRVVCVCASFPKPSACRDKKRRPAGVFFREGP